MLKKLTEILATESPQKVCHLMDLEILDSRSIRWRRPLQDQESKMSSFPSQEQHYSRWCTTH